MFPPVFRDDSKKEFNKYSVQRVIHELQQGNATIGFHPEGRRNPNPDPYSFLPAKAGIGHIASECPNTAVIPVFIIGMTNNYFREVYRNWFQASSYQITVYYGRPLHWDPDTPAHQIAEDTLSKIEELATTHKQELLSQV